MALSDLFIRLKADASGFLMGMRSAKKEAVVTSKSVKEAESRFYALQQQVKKGNFDNPGFRKLKADMIAARVEMDKMRKSAGLLSKGGGGITDMLGKGAALAGGALAAVSVGQIGSGVATQIFGFEQSLADLKAIANATDGEIKELEKTARDLGGSTSFTAAQVLDLQTELSKLGFNVPEVKALSQSVVNLATALDADAGEAAVILGGQLRAFGKDASHAAEFAEILGATANMSAVDFNDFALMLPKVSKAAAEVGWDFAQLNAALGVLRDQNIRAESAGTGLRNILLDNAKAGRTYEQGLQLIANSTDKLKTATELYGSENAIVALTLSKMSKEVDISAEKIRGMNGTLAEMNRIKLDTVQGQFKLLQSAISELFLTLNNGASLKGFVSAAGDAVKGLTQLARYGSVLGKDFDDQLVRNTETVNKYGSAYSKMIEDGKMSTAEFIGMMDKQIATKEKIIAQYPKARKEIKANMQAQLDSLKQIKASVLSGSGVVPAMGEEVTDMESAGSSSFDKKKAAERAENIRTAAQAYKEVQAELLKTRQYLAFVGQETDYVGEATQILQRQMETIFKMGGDEAVKYAELLRSEMQSLVDESRKTDNKEPVTMLPTLSMGSVSSQTEDPLSGVVNKQNQENTTAFNEQLIQQEQLLYNIAQASQVMGDAAFAGFANMASGAATAGSAMLQFGSQAAAGIMEMVRANIMAAISEQAKANSFLGIIGVPLIGAAIGAIFGLMQGAMGKTKGIALAEGGVTTGPTYAMIGDNPSKKELVLPFEKNNEFAAAIGRYMGGSNKGGIGEVRFEIAGDKLYGVLQRVNRKMSKLQ